MFNIVALEVLSSAYWPYKKNNQVMNELIYEGVITAVTNPEPFTAKDGTTHTEKYIVVQTEERFPQSAAIRVLDKIAMMDFLPGDRVRCNIELRASQSQTGKWFNTLKAWKIETI